MTIKQHLIPIESPMEWREALDGIKHTFGHTWENCYAMHLTTGLKTYLYSFEKDNIRIVCPICEREYGEYTDIVKPYGFSGFVGNGDCPEFIQYWEKFVSQREYVCGYLGLNPIFDCSRYFKSNEIYQYGIVYVINLTPSIDELFANLPKDRRWRLGHWEEIRANLVHEKPALEDFFIKNYYHFLRSKNASPVYFFSEETLSFLFSLGNVALVGAQNAGKIVAVAMLAYTADVGDCLFSISLPEGRNHSVALVWYRLNYCKALGIPVFSLGGGSSGDYKRRFGSKALPLKCLKQIYRPEIYEMLCKQINTEPKDMTTYFPAYRKQEFELQIDKIKEI